MTPQQSPAAKEAYERLAPSYDDFTLGYGYKYETWAKTLLGQAEAEGLRGKRLLDVACGTGFSSIPPLDLGWRVTACDISPAMVEQAREKIGDRAELVVADMRELPELGEFDLVWAINAPLSYLLDVEELRATLSGFRRNLAPGGIALFDVFTVLTGRAFLGGEVVVEREGKRFTWKGQASPEEIGPGSTGEGRLEMEGEPDLAHVHRMHHFPEAEVLAALEAAGLQAVGVFGEQDGKLHPGIDEEADSSGVYLCRASEETG
jgi:SAM-dependent methyltransferase